MRNEIRRSPVGFSRGSSNGHLLGQFCADFRCLGVLRLASRRTPHTACSCGECRDCDNDFLLYFSAMRAYQRDTFALKPL